MGRLIDIDRLCDDLVERWNIADKKKEDLIRAVMADVVTPIVVSQPTVDAVPARHGHWIEDPDDWEYQCSECRHLSSCQTVYCSACGARMDGKGNGNETD